MSPHMITPNFMTFFVAVIKQTHFLQWFVCLFVLLKTGSKHWKLAKDAKNVVMWLEDIVTVTVINASSWQVSKIQSHDWGAVAIRTLGPGFVSSFGVAPWQFWMVTKWGLLVISLYNMAYLNPRCIWNYIRMHKRH